MMEMLESAQQAQTEKLDVNGNIKGKIVELCIGADCRSVWTEALTHEFTTTETWNALSG